MKPTSALAVYAALALAIALAVTSCNTPKPSAGGWQGPLIEPGTTNVIGPPTYEAAP